MDWSDLLGHRAPQPTHRIAFGHAPNEFAELWMPAGAGPHPVVVMIHGGCWQKRIASLSIMNYIAEDLRLHGIAVWNIEYRGVDEPGGGYPGTFLDVANAADALRGIAQDHHLRMDRVVAVGHSAGGHLATWLAARARLPKFSVLYRKHPLPIAAVLSQGGLPDLEANRATTAAGCGPEVIDALVGQPVARRRDVFADTSPPRLLPLGVTQVLVNGAQDGIAPPWLARDYRDKVAQRGDNVQLVVVPNTGHVELIAPNSDAWARQLVLIQQLLGVRVAVARRAPHPRTSPVPKG